MAENGFGLKEKELVSVKEEEEEEEEEVFMYSDDESGDTKPMEGLRELGPPAFLKKTYEMVDDAHTDSIISWSLTRDSFIVWDPHKFSADLLPKHFKHNNFSSFIRQLNTYRFRKIDPDRWEFRSEGFEQGKRHLLKHITRRKNKSGSVVRPQDHVAEMEKLRSDHAAFREEIAKLKQQNEGSMRDLAAIRERLRATETKQRHMLVFMIKSFKDPMSLRYLVERARMNKRRRVEHFIDVEELVGGDTQTHTHTDHQDLMIGAEEQPFSWDEYAILWEKLMEETNAATNNIVSELEGLIAVGSCESASV